MKPKKLEWGELSRNERRLYMTALEARKRAVAPISHSAVGSAILTDIGNIYAGWNDEFLGMSKVQHAEVAAIRATRRACPDEEIIAIITVAILDKNDPDDKGFLCLGCRDALWDATGDPSIVVYGASVGGDIYKIKLKYLCPYPHPTRKKWLEGSPSSRLRPASQELQRGERTKGGE